MLKGGYGPENWQIPLVLTKTKVRYRRKNGVVHVVMVTIDEQKREYGSQDKHKGSQGPEDREEVQSREHKWRLWRRTAGGCIVPGMGVFGQEKRREGQRHCGQARCWEQASVRTGRLTSSWKISPRSFQLSSILTKCWKALEKKSFS